MFSSGAGGALDAGADAPATPQADSPITSETRTEILVQITAIEPPHADNESSAQSHWNDAPSRIPLWANRCDFKRGRAFDVE
jgi:hypothetical protein